jgi:hypothetical protein
MAVSRFLRANGIWTSKIGLGAALLYLLVATAIYYHALIVCTDGFFCGVEAIPAATPFGLLFAPLLSDHVPSPAVLQWAVILPTVVCNAALYYLLGVLVTAFRKKRNAT